MNSSLGFESGRRQEVDSSETREETGSSNMDGEKDVQEDEEYYESDEEDLKIRFIPTDINYKRRKRLFTRDLRPMMYGFGDAPQTLPSTVDLMEEMVSEYIMNIIQRAGDLGRKRGRFRTEDIIFLVRKDPKRYARIEELLYMNEELKRARRAFEIEDYEQLALERAKHAKDQKSANCDDKDENDDNDDEENEMEEEDKV
jgi:transcription initiation factor TFIID subunit 13